MEITITGKEMRKALKEIERAERAGFKHCEAIFTPTPVMTAFGGVHFVLGTFFELLEKAHPTDGHLNWGRGQDVTRHSKFIKGKLVPNKR